MVNILLDAVYINQSGGKILLEYFIKNLISEKQISKFFFLFDDRLESNILKQIPDGQKFKVKPSEASRLKFYNERQNDFCKVFCFANVPPPIKQKKSKVYILFHNALILDSKNMDYDYITRLNFFLKRQYIRYRNHENYNWVVQTKNMKALLSKGLSLSLKSIEVVPFFESGRFNNVNKQLENNRGNFLYVADGVKQKNHLTLLSAWEYLLDEHNLPISLHLTVPSDYVSLITEIKRLQNKGANIINHGRCDFTEIELLYRNCNTFITPSLAESFGLPIIEATEAGCNVLAADLPYVYDIINPLATFDPKEVSDVAEKIRLAFLERHGNQTQLIIKNKIQDIINLIT